MTPIPTDELCPRCRHPKFVHIATGCTHMEWDRKASQMMRCRCPGRWSLRSFVA